MTRLLLFDIDATLITTAGLGVKAMLQTGRELFGDHFTADGLEFGGGLDPVLIRRMFHASSVEPTPERLAEFRRRYPGHLSSLLETAPVRKALPGVTTLLDSLRSYDAAVLGLLTGNFEPTGLMKLEACGIPTSPFVIRVWGDDSPHDPPDRAHLPIVAMDRYRDRHAKAIDPADVIIIGDTPHDIRAARACGCRSIGVATGRHGVEELRACGAERAVPDLSATQDLLAWIFQPSGTAAA